MAKAGKNARSARDAAFGVLNRVFSTDAYADALLDAAIGALSVKDRALATELVYGVIKWQIRLDWTIDLFSTIKTRKMEHDVLNAMRLGVYQLLFLSRIPVSAAVNESVGLVRAGGQKKAGFVNAVLRKIESQKGAIAMPGAEAGPVRRLSIICSHPEWMVKRWVERYGADEAERLMRAALEPPPRTLRANAIVTTRDKLMDELANAGFEASITRYSPDGINIDSARGAKAPLRADDERYYIQDEASQIIPYLLAPKMEEAVIDACSAPGGKTTHISALMRNRGVVYAFDLHGARLKRVVETAGRLKAVNIKALTADARLPLEGIAAGSVDAVLLDAPCSGLGVLRRTPDIKLRRKEADIKDLSMRQARLIDNLSGCVKRGGRLVYSACTFEPEETDDIIAGFLSRHEDFAIEDAREVLPKTCAPLVDEGGVLRTFPHRHSMDGFFAARLKRA